MSGIYCADPALQTAVSSALEFYGLTPSPAAWSRRPKPATTFAEQLRRIYLGVEVLALVRQSVPVGADDRRLIERLVDSACQRVEDDDVLEQPVDRQDVKPAPLTTNPRRRPNPPGSSSPMKTNPTRTIRSSRFTAGRKAVRS
jgi:hypothetical protein